MAIRGFSLWALHRRVSGNDRSFVATLAREESNQTVVEGVIEIGRKLGIEVVAEGVETAEQRAWLEQRG